MDPELSEYMSDFISCFNSKIKDRSKITYSWDKTDQGILMSWWKHHHLKQMKPVLKNLLEVIDFLNDTLLDVYHDHPTFGVTLDHELPVFFDVLFHVGKVRF